MRQAIKKITTVVSPPHLGPAPAAASASASVSTSVASSVSANLDAPCDTSLATNAVASEVASKVKHVVHKTIDDVSMTPFLRKITFFSSGGAFLDGYVLAIIGVALTQITPLFNLDTMWSAAVGASVFLGILFGTILGGYLTDLVGRRIMFIIDVVAIGALSVFSMFASDPLQLVLARFVIGFFVGADYPIATSLIAEFTPKHHRSISMGMVSAAWYLGATATIQRRLPAESEQDTFRTFLLDHLFHKKRSNGQEINRVRDSFRGLYRSDIRIDQYRLNPLFLNRLQGLAA